MSKLRRKLKRKCKISISIVILSTLLLLIYVYSGRIIIKNNIINVLTEETPNIKAYSFFKDVTNELKTEDKIDTTKIGEYQVNYYIKTILGYNKHKKVNIKVVDTIKPVLELKGSNKIESYLEDEFKDPGYNVSDNYDKDIKVEVIGSVNTNKIGDYYLTYKAVDSSNNEATIVRKISVKRKSPLKLSLKEFDLNSYFDDIILKENNIDKDYMSKMIFAGDSVPWHFGLDGVYPSSRIWAKPCEGPMNFSTQKVLVSNKQTEKTLKTIIKESQPEYLTLHMGVCDTNHATPEKFIEEYEKVIDYINAESPKTKLIIMSLMPQTKEYLSWIPKRNNVKLNTFNYYLAELCRKKGIPFLNVSSILKTSEGLANSAYFYDDGYHPNIKGMKKIIDYMNNHQYIKGE